MKQYKFLLKPLFFIFNLLFASWMVLKIEKISPSDFGKYRSLFEKETKTTIIKFPATSNDNIRKQLLKNLYVDYKKGVIDSIKLDKQLEEILQSAEETASK